MEGKTKKRLVIGTSVVIILSVGGYYLYKWLKDSGKIGGKVTDESLSEETNFVAEKPKGSKPQITQAQIELATAYRIWANSTDTLNKKYGKDSSYDLNATSNVPYNSYFTKSYAAGKTEYEKAAKDAVASQNDQVAQISAIATRYTRPITVEGMGGMSVDFTFRGTTNGVGKYYKLVISEKSPTDNKKYKGSLVWKLFSREYFWDDWTKVISGGLLTYRNKKYSGSTNYGIGIGAKSISQDKLGKTMEALSSSQIKITAYGTLKV